MRAGRPASQRCFKRAATRPWQHVLEPLSGYKSARMQLHADCPGLATSRLTLAQDSVRITPSRRWSTMSATGKISAGSKNLAFSTATWKLNGSKAKLPTRCLETRLAVDSHIRRACTDRTVGIDRFDTSEGNIRHIDGEQDRELRGSRLA